MGICPPVVLLETGALLGAQVEAEVVGQVPFQFAGGETGFQRRLLDQFVHLGQSQAQAVAKRLAEPRPRDSFAHSPDGENKRMARQVAPFGRQIEYPVAIAVDAQGGVADQQGRVGILEHRFELGRRLYILRLDAIRLAQQDAHQYRRGAAVLIQADAADLVDLTARDQQDAAHFAGRRDAGARQRTQSRDSLQLDRRHQADIEIRRRQTVRHRRRRQVADVKTVAQPIPPEAPGQRPGVQVVDDSNAKGDSTGLFPVSLVRLPVLATPLSGHGVQEVLVLLHLGQLVEQELHRLDR